MKKLVSLMLALALCAALAVPAMAAEFSDVGPDHPFRAAIMDCAEKGIVGGYNDGTFQPAKTVTRSNFCVMLSRAFFADEVAKYTTDKNLQHGTFYPNFLVLFMYGILKNTSFAAIDDIRRDAAIMNTGISRYDMAQLMTNIMNSKGFAASDSGKNAAIAEIADYNEIPGQYKDAVANVYALGIITGYADGSFGGEVTMNRGQAAVVIYRMTQYAPEGAEVPETPVQPETPEAPETPETPVTPAQTETPENPEANPGGETGELTLRDGSAVTEENALKIIEEIKQVYSHGAAWSDRNGGLDAGIRNANTEIGGRKLGSNSGAVNKVGNSYRMSTGAISMTSGCGGFAGIVSDAIFGGNGNGGENFPARKLDNLSQIRPGDILVKLDGNNGLAMHILTAASSVKETRTSPSGVTVYTITIYDGNNNSKVSYNDSGVFATPFSSNSNYYFEAWTRYPN